MVQEKLVSSEKTKNDNNVYHDELIVPKIRFSEFIDSWEKITLNDIATFSKGKGISKNDISDKGTPCIRYGELYTKYNYLISNIDSKTDLDKSELIFSEKNDILMPCSGETAIDLASASCVTRENVAIGGDITVIRTNQYSPFITYCINFKKNEIAKFAQGVSIVHLYAKDFKDITLKIPKIEEQKKNVDILEKIDKKIELLEKKYNEKLIFKEEFFNKYISSLSKETQKIKLNNLIKILNDRNKNNDDLEVLSISNKLGFISQEKQFEDRIVASSDTKNYKIVKKGYFAYNPARINVGSIARLKNYDEGIISPMYIVFKINEDLINPIFFENYLSTNYFKLEILKRLEGSVRLILSAESLKNIEIFIPPLDEQDKISSFMITLTKNLELSKIELDNFKEFKKGLLQKMFV